VSPTSPSSPALSVREETASYSFRYAPGDRVDAAWQEAYNSWVIAALDIAPPRRVIYNKYFSRTHMGDLTGDYNTNGFADSSSFTIHTLWALDNHEVVHVYSALFGTPPALFNEGIAVAHQTDPVRGDLTPRWSGLALHDWARRFRRQGTLLQLGNLLASSDFRRFDPNVTYPQSGSFVLYLLDHYGLERLKGFFRDSNPLEPPASVRRRFESFYGLSIDAAERDWWSFIDRAE
jgi:hypothetical protein